jgi:hypothetical protein
MENVLHVEATILLGDRALRIVDVSPREWLAVLVHNVFANVVGSPCGFIRVARSVTHEHR